MEYRNQREKRVHGWAAGLGWFSIALGLAELVGARPMARMLGMQGDEGLLRLYGLREIGTGVGILASTDPEPWIWGRVAGDGLDLATLAAQFEGNPRKGALMAAVAAVAGATAADVMTAEQLALLRRAKRPVAHDYSDRSGFPMGVEAVRGLAARDYKVPEDMRTPEPLRPGAMH